MNIDRQDTDFSYTPDFKPSERSHLLTVCQITAAITAILLLGVGVTLFILGTNGDLAIKNNYNQPKTTRQMIPGTLPTQINCGKSSISPSIDGEILNPTNKRRIIGGVKSVDGSWPWTVSIRHLNGNQVGHHFCGGALVYGQYVITAAHCVEKKNKLSIVVVVGVTEFDGPVDRSKVYYLSDMIVHPVFDLLTIINDIAVLKLYKPVANVETICLPDSNFTRLFGQKVVLAGWGSTSGVNQNSDLSRSLLQVILKIGNTDPICSPSDTTYCAVSLTGSSNACYGDSGGPLMHYSNGRWYLYGLTSYVIASSDKCITYLPSYYTAIPKYLDWIASAIETMSTV